MNKQQMIDKAIDFFGGDISEFDTNQFIWHANAGKSDQWFVLPDDIGWYGKCICTRQEFEDRVEELNNMKKFKPKIGELCEVTWDKAVNWFECIVSDSVTLRKNIHGKWVELTYESEHDIEFRQIQSEREKALKYVDDKWREHNSGVSGSHAREFFAILYDAGMLKLPK